MRVTRFLLAALLLAVGVAGWLAVNVNCPTLAQGPDQTFRLINIERRLDQLQSRIDLLERLQQNQMLNNNSTSNLSQQSLLELQRQQISTSQQLVLMQQQMLELKKGLDRLAERNVAPTPTPQEKKEKPPEPAKPKSAGRP